MTTLTDPPNDADEDFDGCDIDFATAEQAKDEDLPAAVGGEA
jgi:hypothetical protein